LGASLRRLIKVVGIQSEAGRARLADIEALFEASRDVRAAKRGGSAGESPARAVKTPTLAAAAPGKDRRP
jgi:hypothetical protein